MIPFFSIKYGCAGDLRWRTAHALAIASAGGISAELFEVVGEAESGLFDGALEEKVLILLKLGIQG